MVKEFNLSEERDKIFNPIFLPLNGLDKHTMSEVRGFIEMQDKEFIKRLKEEVLSWNMSRPFKGFIKTEHVALIIDKLAGDKFKS